MLLKKLMPLFKTNKKIIKSISLLLSGMYPFLICFLSSKISLPLLMAGILATLIIRALLPLVDKGKNFTAIEKNSLILVLLVATIMAGISLWDKQLAPFLYPVIMNFGMSIVFGYTLLTPPSFIESIARLSDPDLDNSGINYTRKVTILWMCFCFVNGLISLGTVLLNDPWLWMLYNGCISYVLIGLLMAAEFIFRRNYRMNGKG